MSSVVYKTFNHVRMIFFSLFFFSSYSLFKPGVRGKRIGVGGGGGGGEVGVLGKGLGGLANE